MNASKPILWLAFFCLPIVGLAQTPHPILRSFSAVKQPNGVLLKWVIKGGQQCQGTWVYRAGQAQDFEVINHVEGICGSFTEDETYTYFDNEPLANTYSYYRLEMGFQGLTDTVEVFFEDFGINQFLLLTDDGSENFQILFSNDLNREAAVQVFDLSGKIVLEGTTLGNDFSINLAGQRAGIYILRISGVSETDITGKLYFSGQ
jgi:hypothetical protein